LSGNGRSTLWTVRYPVFEGPPIHRPTPHPPKLLPVSIPHQEQSLWCWVAVGCGIASSYDNVVHAQCAVVNLVGHAIHPPFNTNCCEGDASRAECNWASGTDQALDHAGHHWAGNVDGPIDWPAITNQVDQGRAIGAEIAWAGGGLTHEVAITGYAFSSGDPSVPLIYIQDPGYGPSWYQPSVFTTRYRGNGTWVKTFLSQPAEVVVPGVVGLTRAAADTRIKRAGLIPRFSGPSGRTWARSQDPAAGERAPRGSTVTVQVRRERP
jgi:PASTA domain-containing protein